MEFLWRLGIASEMVLAICTIVTALILYALLRPVSRDLALLMTFFGLVAIAVESAYSLHLVEALFPLGHFAYLKAFTPEQLAAMPTYRSERMGSASASPRRELGGAEPHGRGGEGLGGERRRDTMTRV
jgi:hypothetical protein